MSSEREPPASFLGTGWSFPPAFAAGGAALALASDVDKVHQSLAVLLMTRPGERPLTETFGCDLDAALFAEADQALINRLSTVISDAILRHEPRVVLRGVDVTQSDADPGLLRVQVDYAIPGTNSRFNLVFPFYLNEARVPLLEAP
jgi:phage baseplate assembly protein W